MAQKIQNLPELVQIIKKNDPEQLKQFSRKLMKQTQYQQSHFGDSITLLKQTMHTLCNILKQQQYHPKLKLQTNQIFMYLVLFYDADIYKIFIQLVLPIFTMQCKYRSNFPIKERGLEFFTKTKFYKEGNAEEKNQLREIGSKYVIFCLQTVYKLAQYVKQDPRNENEPSKFVKVFQNLKRQGVTFPKQFQFYSTEKVNQIDEVLKQLVEEQINEEDYPTSYTRSNKTSTMYLGVSSRNQDNRTKKQTSLRVGSALNQRKQLKNDELVLEQARKTFQKQLQIQKQYFESKIKRMEEEHYEKVAKYEKKIFQQEQQIRELKQKQKSGKMQLRQSMRNDPSQRQSDKNKDKIIEDLQNSNKSLKEKVNNLQKQIKSRQAQAKQDKRIQFKNQSMESVSAMSNQIQKLKKENKSLKIKLLAQCSEASQFHDKKSNSQTQNSQRNLQALKFVGSEDAKQNFEPFFSSASGEVKIRLKKAILRQKQLLYKDKMIQVGSITKLESINLVNLVVVFTNISQKPLFNFTLDFVCREDLSVKVLQNAKNYIQIAGQTKIQLVVLVNQIDFRCLLCSIRFNIGDQLQKLALIMPVSKLKLTKQLVLTPIKKAEKLKKKEKVFKPQKKIIPNLHKFQNYFNQAILQIDRTSHQTYILKMQFMGTKFYIECDQIDSQVRIAVMYYETEDFPKAQKLLQELVFLFEKN